MHAFFRYRRWSFWFPIHMITEFDSFDTEPVEFVVLPPKEAQVWMV